MIRKLKTNYSEGLKLTAVPPQFPKKLGALEKL